MEDILFEMVIPLVIFAGLLWLFHNKVVMK